MPIGNNTSGHLFDTTFTADGVLYSDASGVITSTAAGSATQVLTSNGPGVPPTFQAAGGGGGSTVYFSAYKSSNSANATGDGTFFPVVFDATVSNVGSAYSTGTGVFTAPSTGFYSFSYMLTYTGLTPVSIITTLFRGSAYEIRSGIEVPAGAASADLTVDKATWQIPMTAGDTMSITAICFGGTKTVGIGGAAITPTLAVSSTFTGFKIA